MRFVRCKTTSRYEAMILSPEQAYAIVSAPSHADYSAITRRNFLQRLRTGKKRSTAQKRKVGP